MKASISLLSAMVLLAHRAAFGSLCIPPDVQPNSPHSYLVSVANALVYANEGLARPDKSDSNDRGYSLLIALRLQQADYRCSKSQVEPFEESPDSLIQMSAGVFSDLFEKLTQLDDEAIAQVKAVLEPDGSTSASAMAEAQAKLTSSLEQTWGLMPHAAILSTYTVVRPDPSTGKMSRLALSTHERDEILRILRSGFGSKVVGGMKAGQHPLEGAAGAIYQIVGDPKRKPVE